MRNCRRCNCWYILYLLCVQLGFLSLVEGWRTVLAATAVLTAAAGIRARRRTCGSTIASFRLRTSAESWRRRCPPTGRSPRMRRTLFRNVFRSSSALSPASKLRNSRHFLEWCVLVVLLTWLESGWTGCLNLLWFFLFEHLSFNFSFFSRNVILWHTCMLLTYY